MDWYSFILGFIAGILPTIIILSIVRTLNLKHIDDVGLPISLMVVERDYFSHAADFYKDMAEVYSRNFYNEQTTRIRMEGELWKLKEENERLIEHISKTDRNISHKPTA